MATKRQIGFTLIELMVAMAIIAVLTTLIIGAITISRNTATETTNRVNAKTVQSALEADFALNKAYCGFAGGPACNTVYSIRTIAPLLGLPAGNWKTTCTGTCGGTSCNDGGQISNLQTTTYTIKVATWGCTGFITGDVYQVQ